MTPFTDARSAADALFALADPVRLRIAYRLLDGPLHVTGLAEALGVTTVSASHHLGVMRHAGVLEAEREGNRVMYRLLLDGAGALEAGRPWRVTLVPPAGRL